MKWEDEKLLRDLRRTADQGISTPYWLIESVQGQELLAEIDGVGELLERVIDRLEELLYARA